MFESIELAVNSFFVFVESNISIIYIYMIILCLVLSFLTTILNEYNQDKDKFMKILQKYKNKSDFRSNFTLVEMKKDLYELESLMEFYDIESDVENNIKYKIIYILIKKLKEQEN